jgi:hypothetical protein
MLHLRPPSVVFGVYLNFILMLRSDANDRRGQSARIQSRARGCQHTSPGQRPHGTLRSEKLRSLLEMACPVYYLFRH